MIGADKTNLFAVEGKPIIDYPCEWSYHLIGRDESAIAEAVKSVLQTKDHALHRSKQSSKGSFISMKLIVIVSDENERLNLFELLRSHNSILHIL